MTRLEFDNGLQLVRESLFTMTATVTEAIQAATTALLDRNLAAARATAALERELEDHRLIIGRCTLQLLAHEQPTASELRMLVSAIKVSAGCWRMGLLAHHIGMAASRCYPAPAIPDELSGIFRKMGDLASAIADDARAILLSDALDVASLEVGEDAVDGLSHTLLGALVGNSSHDVETAVNVVLLGRYYERLADHAVALARSVIVMTTGRKLPIRAPEVG
jgi:phosphate transport system protein